MSTVRQVRFGTRAYRVRGVQAADIPVVAAHRERVFVEHAARDEGELTAMSAAFSAWLQRKLREGRYVGWLAETGGAIVAGIGVFLVEWPPHPAHFGPLRGYVMNAFTEPGHRGSGLDDYMMRLAAWHARSAAAGANASVPFEALRHESLAFPGTPEAALGTASATPARRQEST